MSAEPPDRAVGVRLVVIYKTVKAALALTLALALFIGLAFGFSTHMQIWAMRFRTHVSHAWTTALAEALVTSSKHLVIAAVALLLDSVATSVEAWALHRGHWWGPWLVVVATGAFLPWEIFELARHPQWIRALLLAINGLIVVYLVFHALAHHRLTKARRARQ